MDSGNQSDGDQANSVGQRWAGSTYTYTDANVWSSVFFQPENVEALAPLVNHLRKYDRLRLKLEKRGGVVRDLNLLTTLLRTELRLKCARGIWRVSLDNPSGIRAMLRQLRRDQHELFFQVRQLGSGMPAYYLGRLHQDYFAEYALIVEDLYMSSGFPMAEERFVAIMTGGHEQYCLRLSQFREKLSRTMRRGPRTGVGREAIDRVLLTVGRHVFEAAWHDDQRPAFLAATHFGLPQFRSAVELLYLCLTGELCALRAATSPDMEAFFKRVFPQPYILALLKQLQKMEGTAINDFPRRALKSYASLSRSFHSFLSTQVPWGRSRACTPLRKLLFANFTRLDAIGSAVGSELALSKAAALLETESSVAIEELLQQAAVPNGSRTTKARSPNGARA